MTTSIASHNIPPFPSSSDKPGAGGLKTSRNDYETPQSFFNILDQEFHFTLDVCALPETAKCKRYFTPVDDGLKQDWTGEVCWMNPPFSDIPIWVKKAYEEAQRGAFIVSLLRSKSCDTRFFHDYIMCSSEIRFVRKRIEFDGYHNYPSVAIAVMIVVFRPYCQGPPVVSSIGNGR